MNDETLKEDLREAGKQMKLAARATLVALRDGVDFVISKIDERGEPDESPKGDTQHETDVPPARPGDEPVRDNAFDA